MTIQEKIFEHSVRLEEVVCLGLQPGSVDMSDSTEEFLENIAEVEKDVDLGPIPGEAEVGEVFDLLSARFPQIFAKFSHPIYSRSSPSSMTGSFGLSNSRWFYESSLEEAALKAVEWAEEREEKVMKGE